MKLIETTCDVCGGPGVATLRTAAHQWYGTVSHTDPRICQEYLEAKRKELDKLASQLKEKINA